MSRGKSVTKMVSPLSLMVVVVMVVAGAAMVAAAPDYMDAFWKSLLFYEGQRSGKLPPNQKMAWRNDSGLSDGSDNNVDLTGGYYDAGDNVKYNFPMAFTTTMLSWSVLEFGRSMGIQSPQLAYILETIKWSTDYLLKSTNTQDVVYVQVGDPWNDHSCWERPEDMDTSRISLSVTKDSPGSEVSGETAAALAAASMAFKIVNPSYSNLLLQRAQQVFKFADTYRGSYANSKVKHYVCPFYCDFSGYEDELLWAAAWLHKATGWNNYFEYVMTNVNKMSRPYYWGDFGWDTKDAGLSVLLSEYLLFHKVDWKPFIPWADQFVCGVVPESTSPCVKYTPGGLMCKPPMYSMQIPTSLSFILVVYAKALSGANRVVQCDHGNVTPSRIIDIARSQVDYVLGNNPMKMSYMVGYGQKFPQRIHHRGSSLPSVYKHKDPIKCKEGSPWYQTQMPNQNLLTGAVVGGPGMDDSFADDRTNPGQSEPTTYINAPLVGLLAYFSHN